jgi:hypothetical protein
MRRRLPISDTCFNGAADTEPRPLATDNPNKTLYLLRVPLGFYEAAAYPWITSSLIEVFIARWR